MLRWGIFCACTCICEMLFFIFMLKPFVFEAVAGYSVAGAYAGI